MVVSSPRLGCVSNTCLERFGRTWRVNKQFNLEFMSIGQKQKEGPGLGVRDLQEGGDVKLNQSKRDRNPPRVFRVSWIVSKEARPGSRS